MGPAIRAAIRAAATTSSGFGGLVQRQPLREQLRMRATLLFAESAIATVKR